MIGSSAIAAIMQSRLAAQLGPAADGEYASGGVLPESLGTGYATAMGQSLYLPGTVILIGLAAALFYARPQEGSLPAARTSAPETGTAPESGTENAARSR